MPLKKRYIEILLKRFFTGSDRTAKLKRNVLFSLIVKVGSIFCSLILVPLTIDFVNSSQYGIWLTISSIVLWMSFFDIGFCNGLRNRLAESFANSRLDLAKTYVSTTYFILTIIFVLLCILCIIIVSVFNMSPLLKIDMVYEEDLKLALIVVIINFCAGFILKILSIILIADQRPARSSFLDFFGQAITLLVLYILKDNIGGSLYILSLSLCIPPIAVWLLSSFYYYSRRYSYCRPSLKHINLDYTKNLLGLGLKFFVIQIAAIIQFQTSNILIARFFSMDDVSEYNVSYKYFNVLNMCFMIFLQPFWSAVTNAYTQGDFQWIKNSIKKYLNLILLAVAGGLIMLFCSDWFYHFWIEDKVNISFQLSCWMLVYSLTTMFGAIFVYFINGIGALKIQYISSLFSPFVFIGLVLFFCDTLHWGMSSILIASILANFNGLILAPIQYYKIVVQRKKHGIWTT